MAGKREAAEDGAVPANAHFPQAGNREDAASAHPGPKHPDRAKARYRWLHRHERKSSRCTELHV